jgi:hypothetical protein
MDGNGDFASSLALCGELSIFSAAGIHLSSISISPHWSLHRLSGLLDIPFRSLYHVWTGLSEDRKESMNKGMSKLPLNLSGWS